MASESGEGSLGVYDVAIAWHVEETSSYRIIARSKEDAKEIARRQWRARHTEKCAFVSAEAKRVD